MLVDAAPKILPEIPTRLGEYAASPAHGRGVEIHVSTRLESADERGVLLSDGTRIETSTLVWTTGTRANPLLAELGVPLDERGRVVVDGELRVSGRDGVWALGDCAAVPNQATPGRTDPPTCQHALRQARRLARNLTGEPKPYRYRMLGQVATLGRYKGIADVMGLRLRGFPGWFVTRTYHLYQLPLFSRKLRVSSSTGRSRSSSAATSRSSECSAIHAGSTELLRLDRPRRGRNEEDTAGRLAQHMLHVAAEGGPTPVGASLRVAPITTSSASLFSSSSRIAVPASRARTARKTTVTP